MTTEEMWAYEEKWGEKVPDHRPIFTCNHKTRTFEDDWKGQKPEAKSAYDELKERGEL